MLEYITQLGENKDLSLKQLSFKLLILMSLVSASRVSEIHALNLCFRYHRPNGVLFKLASLTKKRQPGAALKVCFFASFPEDSRLCVVQCLAYYERVTKEFWINQYLSFFCMSNLINRLQPRGWHIGSKVY